MSDGALMRSTSVQYARPSPRRRSLVNLEEEELPPSFNSLPAEFAVVRGSPGRTPSEADVVHDDFEQVDYLSMTPPPPPRTDSGQSASAGSDARNREAVRDRCAFPGCTRRWDRFRLRDIRNGYRKHYCCSCQLFYCHKHTRVSSHSLRVSCDIGSNCYCEGCFDALDPQLALKLDSNNYLGATLIRSIDQKHGQESLLGASRPRKKSP